MNNLIPRGDNMDKQALIFGILLVGAAFQTNVDVRAAETNSSAMKEGVGIYDYPHSGDNNWSYNSGDPCRDVSYGPMGGTQDWQWKSDSELSQAVECQLSKRPFAQRGEISVSVSDGTATLSGTVKDRASVRSAIVDAYGAGVKDVVSKLEVAEEK